MASIPPRLDEFGLIARYFAPLARHEPGAFGLTDDAAVLGLAAGERLVVTTDAMVAGVHFPANDPPAAIARKLLRVNLSDLAAMGARPRAYTLAAVLPRDTDEGWIAEFAAGLAADQAAFGIDLVGGDTVATDGPATFSLTAIGVVDGDTALRRNGARPGDDVHVSGTIGDAKLGLEIVLQRLEVADSADRAWLVDRFRLPTPRLALGQGLVGIASAAADVSDGLVADLGHVCEASHCGAVIELAAVPLSPAASRAVTDRQPLHYSLLSGGDDYELVFAAPAAARGRIEAVARSAGVRLTRIGSFIEGKPTVAVLDAAGDRIEPGRGGYRHFQ
jgi:thiamine-monophosphate kinase